MTLIQNLPAGTACTIISIEGDGAVARRARELGLVAGTVCTVIRKAPFGGPIEIATAVSRIGIRPSDGLLISVEVLHSTGQVAA
ncbi:MAG: FeoA domain-containing protein [Candidatus Kapabacteria bacterium]|nr:FeoA domain-containing protein [Candidatus Kapabacteria bacterium]